MQVSSSFQASLAAASLSLLTVALPASAQNLTALDLNDDLVINGRDAMVLRQCFNAQASCNPEADFNSDGLINFSDYQILVQHYGQTVPQAELNIGGEQSLVLQVGQSFNVVYSFELDVQNPGSFTLDYSESSDGGTALTVSNDANLVFPTTVSDDTLLLINETLTGQTPGTFTLVKTVTLDDPPISVDHQVTVMVVEAVNDSPTLTSPGAEPPGIPINEPTPVFFSVRLSGTDRVPTAVEIRKLGPGGEDLGLIAQLGDLGTDADAVAGDFVFTGATALSGDTAGIVSYRAVARFANGDTVLSPVSELVVTDLPIGLTADPIEPGDTEIDPASNTERVRNQVLVILAPGVTPEAAQLAVTGLGFEVLGYDPALQTMLIGVPDPVDLDAAITALESLPEFSEAESNGVDAVTAFTPNDPQFGSQWGFTRSRADEAWVISRGAGVLVAVLDTGSDLDHPDLEDNLWKRTITIPMPAPLPPVTIEELGFDMVDGDTVPEDANSHGTHVAGTIAAVTHNGNQVAGMAPDAKILVIRTLGPGGGSHAQFANGVRKAADMGAKIINYSGGGSDSATKKNAVDYAVGQGVLFIAAAGNDSTSSKTSAYPAAYSNVMAIGSTTSGDGRSGFSNFGNWISMAAPGSSILSTGLSGGTATKSGTSMATPHVSGAAALIWSLDPGMTAAQVQERLEKTAQPLSAALQLGSGRLDVFNAIFNSSFELADLDGWDRSGTVASVTALGPLAPQDRNRMAYISTGPAETNIATTFSQSFTVQDDVTSIPVQFSYNFVTEEYPEWVGTEYNDCTLIQMEAPDGSIHTLAYESINGSSFTPIGGIDFPGGDDTVGMTGWKTVAVEVPVTQGPGTYRIFITDAGDDIYDSVVLLDDVRFKASGTAVAPLMGPSCETGVGGNDF